MHNSMACCPAFIYLCALPGFAAVGDAAWAAGVVGKVDVKELDWAQPQQYAAFQPPYDYILAADCVYSELAGAGLLHSCCFIPLAAAAQVI